MAGYSGTRLAKKLGVQPGGRVGWRRAPEGFEAALQLEPSVVVDHSFAEPRRYDVIIVFVPNLAALDGLALRFKPLLKWTGGLWLAWPKRSSSLASDVRDSDVRRTGLEAGLVDNKVCAIDEDWSGLRFVHRKKDRPARRLAAD